MDPTLASAALVAGVGVAVGFSAGLAFRLSERERRRAPAEPRPALPEGVDTVLSVLRSSAIVVNRTLTVIKASPPAYALGVVRRDRIAVSEVADLAAATFRDGEIRQAELAIRRGRYGNTVLYVSARVAPLGTDQVLVLVEDRTQSQRIDDVRRDFVANVSHELKTPVGAISLLAEAVQDASDDPEAVRRFALRMQGESARLTRLVQEIIDLSRLQADDPIETAEPVDIDAVVSEALDRARVDADAKQIRLVSGGDRGQRVLGDDGQLVTAVGNLVENAVAYSPDHTRVAVGVRRLEDVLEISVTDQGIGIPDSELSRIFERFYRVDQARSRKTGGTGLGLSIVKHVAAMHGGEVTVWSVLGAGSTFTLRLPSLPEPLIRQETAGNEPEAAPGARSAPPNSARSAPPTASRSAPPTPAGGTASAAHYARSGTPGSSNAPALRAPLQLNHHSQRQPTKPGSPAPGSEPRKAAP